MTEPQALAGGRYLLVERLGEGGMATVYRCFDQRLQVWRAVKVLLPEYSPKKKIMARFEAEAQTMALLEHPNIVRVYDVGSEGGHAYIVMELVEGGSLVDWLERHGAMPPRLAVDVIVETCQALAFAHRKGVVHRDIKPHNIMVDRDGACRLTDFGIARAGDADVSLTKTGAVMGTWGYMAPEQRTDAKHVDERADIYAMAATLYSLLTDKTPMDLFAADRDDSMLDGVPEPLVAVLVRATEYHKDARYGSADELAAALLGVREDLPANPSDTPPLAGDHSQVRPPPDPTQIPATGGHARDADRGVGETILPDESLISSQLTMPPLEDDSIEPSRQDRAVFVPGADDGPPAPSLLGGAHKRSRAPLWVGIALLLGVGAAVSVALLMPTDGDPVPASPTPRVVEPTAASVGAPAGANAPEGTPVEPEPAAPEATPAARPTRPTPATEAPQKPARTEPTPRAPVTPTPAPTPAPEAVPAAVSEGTAEAPPEPKPAAAPAAAQCIKSVVVTPNADSLGFRAKSCLGANNSQATLHYRPIGGGAYYTKEMRSLANQHVTNISDAEVMASGVEYFIESEGVTDGSAASPKTWKN